MSSRRKQLEDILARLRREASGGGTDRPVTEREMRLLQEQIRYDKRMMRVFYQCVSYKQAELFKLLETKDQIIMWGGNRAQKTDTQVRMIFQLMTGYSPVEYTEVLRKDGQKCLLPRYEKRETPIIPLPCNIGVSLLNRGLQRKPGAFEAKLEKVIPKAWIAKKRKVADYLDYIELINGSRVTILSSSSGAESYQGAEYDVVVMDEAQDEDVFSELISRVGSRTPMLIMGFFTNRGRNWAYNLFIKPEEQGQTPPNRAVVRMSMLDNPFIPLVEKEKMITTWRQMNQLDIRLHGGFDDLVGVVYKNFNKKTHVISAADVKGFIGGAPPKNWPVISGLDCHHTSKGCAASWVTIDPSNGRCYLFKEYESTEEPSRWIEDLNEINARFPSIVTFADPSMDATDNRGYNLWNEFRRNCTLPLRKATRDHTMGIHAVTEAFADLRDDMGKPVDNRPALLICDHCTKSIEQIEEYHRKTGAVNEVVKENDEFCDTLRYMMVSKPAQSFLVKAGEEEKKDTKKYDTKPEGEKKRGAFIYSDARSSQTPKDGQKRGVFLYSITKPQDGSTP